jgi:hypothetical protein
VLKCIDALNEWCCAPPKSPVTATIVTDCCTIASRTFQAAEPTGYATAQLPAATLTADATSSVTSTASSTTSSAATGSPTSAPASQASGLGTGAKIGLGVGLSLGALVLLLLGVIVWQSRRKAAAHKEGMRDVHPNNTHDVPELASSPDDWLPMVHSDKIAPEMDGFATQRLELQGSLGHELE